MSHLLLVSPFVKSGVIVGTRHTEGLDAPSVAVGHSPLRRLPIARDLSTTWIKQNPRRCCGFSHRLPDSPVAQAI